MRSNKSVTLIFVPDLIEEGSITSAFPFFNEIDQPLGSPLVKASILMSEIDPIEGKMYLFPSWLKHSVYPFYCEGERRSLSFNAFFRK